jgi:hypothetical protein
MYRLLPFGRGFSCRILLKIKKRLPTGAIPGIPRLRAGTGLFSIGNYIASRHFQRSRARAGARPVNIASYGFRAGDQVRAGASDHERTGTSKCEETGEGDNERNGASDYKKAGTSNR